MNVHVPQLLPEMGELNVSNDLLGDPVALQAAWERDGYWFFRDVLDKQVIARIRETYVDYLVEMGIADANDPDARYNGSDYSDLPINSNITKLNERKIHRMLHEAPTINAFFTKLFGCDPFWVPFTVHRTNPPVKEKPATTRFDFLHADSVYNEGLPFLICWVPLDDIDEEVGGLALAEGVDGAPLHPKDGMKISPIPLERVPHGVWRRAHYRPGDVLIMSMNTPHSGIANISRDRFRFSMDTRIMPSTGHCPIIGTVKQISTKDVTITTADGEDLHLHFTPDSFVRGKQGDQMPLADVPARYALGSDVIAMVFGDKVSNLRPQT